MAEAQAQAALGWAARDTSGILSPFSFSRRSADENDVTVKILYCGLCHTDLHTIKNDWGNAMYPVVPGHEIVGIVTKVGPNVTNFKPNDKVGIGYFIGSCQKCDTCTQKFENFCPNIVITSNGIYYDGSVTYGGFSNTITVNSKFVVKVPDNLSLDKTAPLLCAGVTVYSPMKRFGLDKPGLHLGVVGLGGLGHVAVKFGKAFGMKVTVISTSIGKKQEAVENLGADDFLVSKDPEQMKAAIGTMDGIIDTVSAAHPVAPLLALLKVQGKMIIVGAPPKPFEVPAFSLIPGGKILAGGATGSMKETQDMLDFAGEHNIGAEIELVKMDYVNTAVERLGKGDIRYRFVIDIANSLNEA